MKLNFSLTRMAVGISGARDSIDGQDEGFPAVSIILIGIIGRDLKSTNMWRRVPRLLDDVVPGIGYAQFSYGEMRLVENSYGGGLRGSMDKANTGGEKTDRARNSKSDLEMMYIDEYLQAKGYSRKELATLPEEQTTKLMSEASQYASFKLEELESRARLLTKIHDANDF
jgi:hypothetical protein